MDRLLFAEKVLERLENLNIMVLQRKVHIEPDSAYHLNLIEQITQLRTAIFSCKEAKKKTLLSPKDPLAQGEKKQADEGLESALLFAQTFCMKIKDIIGFNLLSEELIEVSPSSLDLIYTRRFGEVITNPNLHIVCYLEDSSSLQLETEKFLWKAGSIRKY